MKLTADEIKLVWRAHAPLVGGIISHSRAIESTVRQQDAELVRELSGKLRLAHEALLIWAPNDARLTQLKSAVARAQQWLDGAEPASPWLPIESAPRDGRTLLLGYFNSLGNWRTLRGQWFSQDEIDDSWEEPEDGSPGWHETVVEYDMPPNCFRTSPTHWMPLPPAPQPTKEQE